MSQKTHFHSTILSLLQTTCCTAKNKDQKDPFTSRNKVKGIWREEMNALSCTSAIQSSSCLEWEEVLAKEPKVKKGPVQSYCTTPKRWIYRQCDMDCVVTFRVWRWGSGNKRDRREEMLEGCCALIF